MREAGFGFFSATTIFAPFGTDLALHTHTAFQAAVAATLFKHFDITSAQNLVIIQSLTLNFACTYWLAWVRTRTSLGAFVAALILGGSPVLSAHLMGHFNLISFWPVPLVIGCVLHALDGRSRRWSIAAGLSMILLAYTDYYFSVYAIVLVAGILVWRSGTFSVAVGLRLPSRTVLCLIAILEGVILLASSAILVTGGIDTVVAGIPIRATAPGNLLSLAWLICLVFGWESLKPRLSVPNRDWRNTLKRDVAILIPAVAVFLLGVAPILWHILHLVLAGDYAAPPHQWRSGPAGVDLLTFVLGNPSNPVNRSMTLRAYGRLGLDHIEGVGWLGVAPTAVLIWSTAASRRRTDLRPLLLCAFFFLVWSLGPWLKIAGVNTGLILPANFFGFVPVISNARIPGRALIMAFLAIALMAARLISSMPARGRMCVGTTIFILTFVDFMPAPVPMVTLHTPELFAAIPRDGGIVLELPVGLRDGFEEIGSFDERTLLHQTVHGHPIVGGFAARLPSALKKRFAETPVLRSMLAMSGGAQFVLPDDASLTARQATSALAQLGVKYIVLDRNAATQPLCGFVESLMLTRLQTDGTRDLFLVTDGS